MTPRDAELERLRTENARFKEALEYYASGGKASEKFPYKEFGCGCCAGSAKLDMSDGRWELDWELCGSEAQGIVAKQALHGETLKDG